MKTLSQTSEQLYTTALQELKKYHFRKAKKCFIEATTKGHERATKFLMYWCRSKDKNLARDIILCAERQI